MQPVPPDLMPGERKLDGLADYEAALDALIANTTQTLRMFDRRLSRGFNTPQRAALLRNVLLANHANRIYIVLHETSAIVRDQPRLMILLKQFSHNLFINQTLPDARRVYDPFAIADDTSFVRRFHYDSTRGIAAVGDIAATSTLQQRFEEIWAASSPAVAATTTGL